MGGLFVDTAMRIAAKVPDARFPRAARDPRDAGSVRGGAAAPRNGRAAADHPVRPRARGHGRRRRRAGRLRNRHAGSGAAQAPHGDHLPHAAPFVVAHAFRSAICRTSACPTSWPESSWCRSSCRTRPPRRTCRGGHRSSARRRSARAPGGPFRRARPGLRPGTPTGWRKRSCRC